MVKWWNLDKRSATDWLVDADDFGGFSDPDTALEMNSWSLGPTGLQDASACRKCH